MEHACRFLPSRGRAALLATACLIVPVLAGEPAAGIFDRELAKRYRGVEEAQELLTKGDQSYKDGNYGEAVEAYSGARELIPDAPATGPLRDAATSRFAQASVEQARSLSRKGDVAQAKLVVGKVLALGVSPEDPGALAMRDQLDDPIRTNPALTAEHANKVDAVRKLLYTGEGAYNLGKFDEAKRQFEKILTLDATNSAARRWLERVASAKSSYQSAAYDQTRSHMLSEVDALWETSIPPDPSISPALSPIQLETERPTISAKLNRIILPSLNLEKVSLQEALDYLRTLASNNDVTELDPANKGVNITLNLGPEGGPEVAKIEAKRFDLRLRSVPLSQALKYICEATDTMLATDDYAVTIRPVGSNSSEMISRNFRVPPDFLSSAGDSASSSAPAEDPFNSKPPAGGLLPTRRGAKEILQSSGINFPEGSSANFNAASNTLLIRNTPANIDLISQFVESVSKTEPVQVIVTVTMIRTEQRNLQELGFDWLLDQFGLGGGGFPPGTDAVTLSGGTQGTGGDLGDIALASSAASRKPITAGNRSGDGASSRDGIDDLIATNQQGFGTSSSRAPGVLAVNGLLNGTSLQAVMRGLDQKKGQDLMTTSSTVTRSGQSASVRVIREFIYPTEYEPPQLPNTVNSANGGVSPVTPATPKAFEKKDVGVIVEVLPTVSQDRHFVDIQLNPSIIDFDGFVNYGSPINSVGQATVFGRTASPIKLTANAILQPVFSVQRTNTHLTIADGATVVIGGLIQEKIQLVDDKTPILGNLPLVGRLFQSKVSAPTKKAIVFLVNVKLVDPTGRPINQP